MADRQKYGGRKAGTPNRITSDLREYIDSILKQNFTPEKVEKELEQLEPKEKLLFYVKLLSFAVPKKRQIEGAVEPPVLNIHTTLTEEELKAAIQT